MAKYRSMMDWPAYGVPPHYRRRWSVLGRLPGGTDRTTLFDQQADDPRQVVAHLAAVHMYSVLLDRAGVRMLLDTVESGDACAVPIQHAVHGRQLMGVHPLTLPAEPSWTDRPAGVPASLGPTELYLRMPGAQLFIQFTRERAARLATVLAEILEELPEQASAR